MIDELHVANLALIKDATLCPSDGMTVLTGETGAGKTALLAACRLAMGDRADKTMVREGQDEALCEIRLFDSGQLGEQDEVVAVRKVSCDGRSRCKIDGSLASVGELARTISPYIDLCSQHDQRLLASQSVQRALLDTWASAESPDALTNYRGAYMNVKEKRKRLDDIAEAALASDEALLEARRIYKSISSLGPSVEDYEQISSALKKAENAEMLARTSSEAQDALAAEGGALDLMNAAVVALEDGAQADESLSELASTLRDAVYIAEDVSRDVSSYASAIELDVGELEFMQERMAAYQSLMRSHGPSLEDVLSAQDKAKEIIDATENSDKTLEEAKKELAAAEERLSKVASDLRDSRFKAAPSFAAAANEVLEKLNMQGARMEFQIKELPRKGWTEDGPDDVRMMFVPAEGMQPRQLSKIASGGELSRVMLSIRAAMGERDAVSTLVFDEIDSGVGGESALALSEVLHDLSRTHQVIVVTHLAQIAAKADKHYLVEKEPGQDGPETKLSEIDSENRAKEIARMFSGSITESSLAHAKELLER